MKTSVGFTLIEVLIAMIILAGGLLGLAALQAASLKNNQSAYYRSQATQLAYDLADRIRANVNGAGTYRVILPSAATAQADCTSVSTTCTAADMATNDLYEWGQAVGALPSGEAIVCLDSTANDGNSAAVPNCEGTGSTYSIKIWWDDDRSGNKQRFVVSFRL